MKYLLVLLALHTLIQAQTPAKTPANYRIQGKVLEADTGKEIANAHVYIVHGEEEALTNTRGQFAIDSWQKLPLRVYVAAKGYQNNSIVVKNPRQAVTIYLRQQ